ncbi:ubiquinol-cytochrome-c reductase hinge protein [Dictyostelium discoideum AX4]|uniref:Probable cytochrome b-c1 complex subunit 6 n=1 Tax=Dictyostelium discoideum TaxID=44689 RepID=QCR6_DICDI|nr:ubiquinol-cytochrome-c reductase hinge protein [Dictyostelium discoideum AX4]Q1ZXP3.1 RecName: Full=Probable cytochrome b-c1 complex subunit 6; AltName: Full=Ubiquinol-cytochrome c reductase complex subunit 6 [Dictyostelium discoideum]EAS66929.1 ubiquinol-cytochrome-c reductase hinge protein [Dictyostelium discoideum AX4]|eukprot:XP_001134613.1 ubiquinol-cytochrome-c reductase hinge protein [Dictyostelium discoideum AX4]
MQTSECKVKGPIQEGCASGCEKSWSAYQACSGRVAKLEHDEKANCLGQFLEHVQCIDKCVGPKLFAQLK